MRVEREITIEAPPENVFRVVTDARLLERWVSIHDELVKAPKAPLDRGDEIVQKLKLAGRAFKVKWKVTESEPHSRVVWEGKGPLGSTASVIYELEPSGDGTHFTYTNEYDLPGGPLGRAAGPAVKRVTAGEVDESLRRLKEMVE